MKIAVFGLGYVGSVTAACLADRGHTVVAVDVSPDKVEHLRSGRSPVLEKDLPELVRQGVDSGRLTATSSAKDAVLGTDLAFVCVGTPAGRGGGLELDAVERVCRDIGQSARHRRGRYLVVVRSTVLPGTCRDVLGPALAEASSLELREEIGLVYHPEFLREGSSVDDFFHPSRTVIGARDDGDAATVQRLYEGLDTRTYVTDLEVAEMIKYVDNPFHALKVAFANEVGTLCRSLGVDAHRVIDLFLLDEKLNLSAAYLRPGFAFGGSCLPKDVRAVLHRARRHDLELPLFSSILPSNEIHLQRALSLVLSTGRKKVGLVGLSFKSGTDDLRESPAVRLAESLLGKGIDLRILDRSVSLSRLVGANRLYIEKEIPHIGEILCQGVDELVDFAEVVVLTRSGEDEREVLTRLPPDRIAIDVAGMRQGAELCKGAYLALV